MTRSRTHAGETPARRCERNRANARHSAGPRSDQGRAVSRGNALRHGLCANPAAGVVEDRRAFEDLHAGRVERRFQGRCVMLGPVTFA